MRSFVSSSLSLLPPFESTSTYSLLAATNITFRWEDPSASKKMHEIANHITDILKQNCRDAGAFIPFTYANTAGVEDTTFAALPEKTRKRLRDVAAIYDPEGIMQSQATGFKLE